jgi:halocyanin-like protein
VGAAAAATAVGVVRPATAQGGVDYGGWFGGETGGETTNFDGTVDRTGNDAVTVEVGAEGNGGPYAFAPAAVRVDPGTTVTFDWVSDTHNILIEEQPEGAEWSGVGDIENTGFTHEHTFETEGVYKYYCQPHLALGMKGAVVVGGSGGTAGDGAGTDAGGGGESAGGDGGGSPTLSLAFRLVGGTVAVSVALILGVAGWALLNYDRPSPAAAPAEREPAESVFETGVVTELGHDEFDPYGTATLVAIYTAIIGLLWVFMYFIEFLGGGPTVIG